MIAPGAQAAPTQTGNRTQENRESIGGSLSREALIEYAIAELGWHPRSARRYVDRQLALGDNGAVLTVMSRLRSGVKASVPVDLAVGELVARRGVAAR